MPHGPDPMLATLVACILLAFLMGSGARMLRLPALIGYIAAGVAIGPYLPGALAERGMVTAMADIGVALLLFSIGLHFRAADLLAVWRVAVPGALAQIAIALGLGALVGQGFLALETGPSLAFGLVLAISSTAVATKSLEERGKLGGTAGRIALGWLVMQDLVVVFALVLVPALASGGGDGGAMLWELGRAALSLAAFVLLMAVAGRRLLPLVLTRVARGGSRELFTLAVLAAALGVAVLASSLFGVSFALGAFFAGVLLGESDVGHQAAAEATPLTRIFSAIFFVSVGLLLDLGAVGGQPLAAFLATLSVILGIGGSALALLLLLGVGPRIALIVAAGLSQIGEFSFLVTEMGIRQALLPETVRGPVLMAAIGSIIATPLLLKAAEALAPALERRMAARSAARAARARPTPPPPPWPVLKDHAIIVGAGRVGATIIGALRRHHLPLIVMDEDRASAERLQAEGVPTIWGDATRPEVFAAAAPERARILILALPGALEAREVLRLARQANPAIQTVVRSHSETEATWLEAEAEVGLVMMGEREIALGMADYAMQRLGLAASTAQATVDVLRRRKPEGGN
ncbi:cation:proton antiporter [Falsiroseomonas selenitidurans]|uniref:Sodium:proton antiporter n=1 Tax=Falsiroseomonas selenitidurans TaxID=2716335 RepID=A0ABX1E7F7_9PROT|nr:cation:proton antiporter [Falsiroseomonas selenitidurans]NKC31722.1 sodium:proton antiporter [Falsiroseomonas selenitidurans]